MKLVKSEGMPEQVTFDMTPMIDCTFQLVIFFMLTLNFANDQQNEMIRLPISELAKPAEKPLESPITLQLTDKNRVIVNTDEVAMTGLKAILQREKNFLAEKGKGPGTATVVIRADSYAKTGKVQEMIEISQSLKFEKFVLRAKEGGA
jgi:biopolymer transport protein ExbD